MDTFGLRTSNTFWCLYKPNRTGHAVVGSRIMMARDGGRAKMASTQSSSWGLKAIAGLACIFLMSVAKGDDKSAALYKAKCAVCHGAAGKGDSPAGKSMGVVSFSDPKIAAKSDAELKDAIEKGKNKMPAYGKSLKPDEIQGLVAYIRSLK
jgi:cytochrome c6